MWWGGASRRRAPSSMPAGYASQTGYQYDSISRVAGHRELAPPSKFSNEGGFKNSVFRGIEVSDFSLTSSLGFLGISLDSLGLAAVPESRTFRKRSMFP